jgi:DUF971 family protein
MTSEPPWPVEIRLKSGAGDLEVSFDDGTTIALPAEFLRVLSPSAEVKGHGPGQEVTVAGKRRVKIRSLEPVGNYALRILFDDGHDTGLYTWSYLFTLGRQRDHLWGEYLARLAARGLSRD